MKQLFKIFSLAIVISLFGACTYAQKVLVDADKNYSNIKAIEVDGGWLEVTYVGGSSAEVNVKAYLESTNENQDIIFVTIGDVLKISHEQSSNNSSWGNTRSKGYIKITGPESIALDMRNSSGSLEIENVINKQTNLRVSSGKITASNIDGDLSIKASSGSLNASKVNGNVEAEITSGNVNINTVAGNLDYKSTSGSLDADRIEGELNVSITSGSVKLSNIGSLGTVKFTSGNVRATNAGLGSNTNFNGTSGNFRIQTSSNLKDFNFSLRASSGNLTVGGISTGKTLDIDNGSNDMVKGSISSGNISIDN